MHFRKFVSERILKEVLSKCPDLKVISMSAYAKRRCKKSILRLIKSNGIRVILRSCRGRPSFLEKCLEDIKLSRDTNLNG